MGEELRCCRTDRWPPRRSDCCGRREGGVDVCQPGCRTSCCQIMYAEAGLSRPWLLWLTECCLQGKDSTQRPQSTPPRLWWKECAARRGNMTSPRRLLRGKLQRVQQQHASLGQRRKARLAHRERTPQQGGTGTRARARARAVAKGTWMSTGMRTISSPIFCSTSRTARTILTELTGQSADNQLRTSFALRKPLNEFSHGGALCRYCCRSACGYELIVCVHLRRGRIHSPVAEISVGGPLTLPPAELAQIHSAMNSR